MINFDKSRVKHPELWEGCMRAFNPAGIFATDFDSLGTIEPGGSRGVYPDYAFGMNGRICRISSMGSNVHFRPEVHRGVACVYKPSATSPSDNIRFSDSGLPNDVSTPTTNITMSVWMYVDTYDEGSGVSLIFTYGDASEGSAFGKCIYMYLTSGGLAGGTYGYVTVNIPWSVFISRWVHVTLTKQNLEARMYIDGKFNLSRTIEGSIITLAGAETGSFGSMNDSGWKYPFVGYLGPATIHNRILSDQEIQLLASDPQVMYEERRFRRTGSTPASPSLINRRRKLILPQWC